MCPREQSQCDRKLSQVVLSRWEEFPSSLIFSAAPASGTLYSVTTWNWKSEMFLRGKIAGIHSLYSWTTERLSCCHSVVIWLRDPWAKHLTFFGKSVYSSTELLWSSFPDLKLYVLLFVLHLQGSQTLWNKPPLFSYSTTLQTIASYGHSIATVTLQFPTDCGFLLLNNSSHSGITCYKPTFFFFQ